MKRLITAMLIVLSVKSIAIAKEPELKLINATYYTSQHTAKTASGQIVREGIVAADQKPGTVAIIYQNDGGKPGQIIGYYEVLDKGGAPIMNGRVIDIWAPDDMAGQEIVDLTYENDAHGTVFVQYVEAEG